MQAAATAGTSANGGAPDGALLVAESGIAGHADLERLARARVRAFLVGESLMRQPDIVAATRALLGN